MDGGPLVPAGFFNPLFWPSLAFRTAVACMFAGVYAFLTTAFLDDPGTKRSMTLFSAKWVLVSWLAAIPCGIWYFRGVPPEARSLVAGASPTIQRALQAGLWAVVALALLTLLLVSPEAVPPHEAGFDPRVPLRLVFMGAFEWTREAARRPYVINRVMYSNGICAADVRGSSGPATFTPPCGRAEGDRSGYPGGRGKGAVHPPVPRCHTSAGSQQRHPGPHPEPVVPGDGRTTSGRSTRSGTSCRPSPARWRGAGSCGVHRQGLHGKEIAEGPPAAGAAPYGQGGLRAALSVCHTLEGGDNPLPPKVAGGGPEEDPGRARPARRRWREGVMPPLKAPPPKRTLSPISSSRRSGEVEMNLPIPAPDTLPAAWGWFQALLMTHVPVHTSPDERDARLRGHLPLRPAQGGEDRPAAGPRAGKGLPVSSPSPSISRGGLSVHPGILGQFFYTARSDGGLLAGVP